MTKENAEPTKAQLEKLRMNVPTGTYYAVVNAIAVAGLKLVQK